jgi:hypothetical protein
VTLPSEFGTTLSSSVFKLRVPSGLRVSSTASPLLSTRPLGLTLDFQAPSGLLSLLPPPLAAAATVTASDGGGTTGGGSSRRVLLGR